MLNVTLFCLIALVLSSVNLPLCWLTCCVAMLVSGHRQFITWYKWSFKTKHIYIKKYYQKIPEERYKTNYLISTSCLAIEHL